MDRIARFQAQAVAAGIFHHVTQQAKSAQQKKGSSIGRISRRLRAERIGCILVDFFF
jgi:hypothetical protein